MSLEGKRDRFILGNDALGFQDGKKKKRISRREGNLSLKARQGLSFVITTFQEIVLVSAFMEGSGRQSGT